MDKIKIKDLEIYAYHGVFTEETTLGQKFLISAELYTDTRNAGKTDDLNRSVDYGKVCKFINQFLTENTYKLLETAAESVTEALLLAYPLLKKITLEIKKPWAPVGLPIECVSVEIERAWHTTYIAIGSNVGDRESFLKKSVEDINNIKGCRVEKVSSFIETEPYGMKEQGDFLNGCLKVITFLSPEELLSELNRIEDKHGRKREMHWGPRTLDLDIIFYDDLIFSDENLCIPHIEYAKREFVLEPLCEIDPYLHDPISNKTIKDLLEELRKTYNK